MNTAEITVLLEQASEGDQNSFDHLIAVIYPELKQIASGIRHKQINLGETLNTTSLVNEAWLKLQKHGVKANNRKHFFCIAAKAMRQILMNAAAAKKSQKRNANLSSFDDIQIANEDSADWLLKLDEVLLAVGKQNNRAEEVFQLKYFLSLENTEVAEILGVSEKTVLRDWRLIKHVVKEIMN